MTCPFTAKAALYMERTADWTTVSPLTTIGLWNQGLAEISEDVVRLDRLDKDHFRLACTRRIERHLVSVVTNATCFLRDLGVEDPAAAFVAEWERAAVKPSALDTVVKYARRDDQGSKVDVDGYVARLLRSMPSDTVRPEYLDLLRIAKESAQHLRWCGFLDPWAEVADEARALTLPKTEDGRFTLLVKRIGAFLVHRDDDTATDIGAAALAWAAQIIEEEDQ